MNKPSNKNNEARRLAEATVVASIQSIADNEGVLPGTVDYVTWLRWCKEENQEAIDAYKLLDVKFGIIKKANFVLEDFDVNPVRVEISNRAKQLSGVLQQASFDALYTENFEKFAQKIFTNKIVPVGFAKDKPTGKTNRELNLILSDLHFGASLKAENVLVPYGPHEEARRLAAIVKQVCEYKEFYREETQLNLHIIGDIIQNSLHDVRDGEYLSKQNCTAMYLLSQAVGVLAANFPKVVVRCLTGNHGRRLERHHDRAVKDKHDSHETDIYFAVKLASKSLNNVSIEIPTKAYYEYDSFGDLCFASHGDTVLKVGYPGTSLDIKSLEQQTNKISASRKDGRRYKLFFIGHTHTGAIIHLPSTLLIYNGALIPGDEYGISIGSFETRCGQYMWESIPGHLIGDTRFIEVNEDTDKDAYLEKIIKPFSGF